MAINIGKVLVEYLKGSVLDLVKGCLRFSSAFYVAIIYIEEPRIIFFLVAY